MRTLITLIALIRGIQMSFRVWEAARETVEISWGAYTVFHNMQLICSAFQTDGRCVVGPANRHWRRASSSRHSRLYRVTQIIERHLTERPLKSVYGLREDDYGWSSLDVSLGQPPIVRPFCPCNEFFLFPKKTAIVQRAAKMAEESSGQKIENCKIFFSCKLPNYLFNWKRAPEIR